MSWLDLTFALALTVLGLGLISWIVIVILRQLPWFRQGLHFDFSQIPMKLALKRYETHLRLADELIKRGRTIESIKHLRSSFYLAAVSPKRGLIELVGHHNMSALERLITIAEEHNQTLSNLPIIEDLIYSRSELFKSLAEARAARSGLTKKRDSKGQPTPDWAKAEFDKKVSDIEDRLHTNRQSLENQLRDTYTVLERLGSPSDVTYH